MKYTVVAELLGFTVAFSVAALAVTAVDARVVMVGGSGAVVKTASAPATQPTALEASAR